MPSNRRMIGVSSLAGSRSGGSCLPSIVVVAAVQKTDAGVSQAARCGSIAKAMKRPIWP
jgi:hypothetical protein